MQQDPVVIVSALRTPTGKFLGELKSLATPQLAKQVIQAILGQTGIDPQVIDQAILGCVLTAGLGQAPARQAIIMAGLPVSLPCTTINKMCGSGMQAVMFAHDSLSCGHGTAILAGGMENMSRAPYLLLKAREGYRLGHHHCYDHMMLDGLEDAYDKGKAMGVFADECAAANQFSRKEQDDFAMISFERAQHASKHGYFTNEIVPLAVKTKQGEQQVIHDEPPFAVAYEKIPTLKPVFQSNGVITAGNASSIADGSAVLLLMKESTAKQHGLIPLARIISHAVCAVKPDLFPIAPIDAVKKVLHQCQWQVSDVDLFEVNEAFAVVTLAVMRALNIPHEKMNIQGGACALGHPIGASGARILVTLLHALKRIGKSRGVASLCIGGGEATAIAIELCT